MNGAKWSVFSAIEKRLLEVVNDTGGGFLTYMDPIDAAAVRGAAGTTLRILRESVKFYLPSMCIEPGRHFSDFKEHLRLPFDVISVLSSERDSVHGPMDMITVAMAPEGAYARSLGVNAGEGSDDHGNRPWCLLTDVMVMPDNSLLMCPVIAVYPVAGEEQGISVEMMDSPYARRFVTNYARKTGQPDGEEAARDIIDQMKIDITAVTNLCVMLSLKNVEKREIQPPAALNAKRRKKGRLPLYSYHVLEVDGEVWDNHTSTGQGNGVRSHLRRGHIRRIPSGRCVWVRAAYVHGSADGFVDKDYTVAAR